MDEEQDDYGYLEESPKEEQSERDSKDYLQMASDAFSTSTNYVDSNYRKKWEDAINMFQSRHPSDSKYNSEAYKYRSKVFRPKSRSVVRRHEAAAAAAFFSNMDVVSIDAEDQSSKERQAGAELMKEVLGYRLTKTIPWFQTLIGAFQDTLTVGVTCSYQSWKYRAETVVSGYEQIVGFDGQVSYSPVQETKVIEDKPCIELIPPENIRIDPAAEWRDPIRSSPYVIHMMPMYACDVKEMMETVDDKTGQPKWKKYDDSELLAATTSDVDTTRQAREGLREDSKTVKNALQEYDIVWIHKNIMRVDGADMLFYTVGTQLMLSDPVPLKEVYFTGERPYVMGVSVIETHKTYPNSIVMLGDQLQREANEIQNQRLDNVKLVLNKRYIVKRGAQVDLKSITRNVPGSVTLANNPIEDVREVNFPDVTGSSYQEQDRVNVDYDELTGNFSSGSVQTNRSLNETVGGMNLISSSANQVMDYTIRIFTETWVEPVLRQLIMLEQHYETDSVIIGICAQRAKLWQKYGVNRVTDDLMNQDLLLRVNVGMGATNPQAKLNSFIGAMMAYGNLMKTPLPGLDTQEIGKEVFALSGYKDGGRFLMDQEQNSAIKNVQMQAQQFVQQAMQKLQQDQQKLKEMAAGVEQQKSALEKRYAEINGDLKNRLLQITNAEKVLSLEEQLANQSIEQAISEAEQQRQSDIRVANDVLKNISERVDSMTFDLDNAIRESVTRVLNT